MSDITVRIRPESEMRCALDRVVRIEGLADQGCVDVSLEEAFALIDELHLTTRDYRPPPVKNTWNRCLGCHYEYKPVIHADGCPICGESSFSRMKS